MPSLIIRDCRVVRLMPSLAAAPVGPPMIQLVSLRTRTMCSRSAFARVAKPSKAATGATFVLCFNSASEICSSPPRERITLDEVCELAHIAWPMVFRQSCHGFGRDRTDGFFHPPRMFLREVAREERDVFAPIAQRRDHHRENVEPVIEIAAKLIVSVPDSGVVEFLNLFWPRV